MPFCGRGAAPVFPLTSNSWRKRGGGKQSLSEDRVRQSCLHRVITATQCLPLQKGCPLQQTQEMLVAADAARVAVAIRTATKGAVAANRRATAAAAAG